MVFIIKATYNGETRRWTLPEDTFPTYQTLTNQIHKVFKTIDNFYLGRVAFISSAETPVGMGTLIATQVKSADDWEGGSAASYVGQTFPTGILKFIIHDVLNHRKSPIEVGSASATTAAAAMDVDPSVSNRNSLAFTDHSNDSCCSVSSTKTEIKEMFDGFIKDLNKTMSETFGEAVMDTTSRSATPVANMPGAFTSSSVADSATTKPVVDHPGVTCDHCHLPLKGTRFKCQKCANFDICEKCMGESQDGAAIHSALFDETHEFNPIPARQTPVRASTVVVHHGFTCDHCNTTPRGVRYHCDYCVDFDICESCMGSHQQGAILHNASFADLGPKHSFTSITASVRPPNRASSNPLTNTPAPGEAVHNAYCNVCSRTIVGIRQKCLDCADYDMCMDCFTIQRAKHDEDHQFYGLTEPGRVVVHEVERTTPVHDAERPFPRPGPRFRRGFRGSDGEAPEEFRGPPWARRGTGEAGPPWARMRGGPSYPGRPHPHPHQWGHPGRPHHGPFPFMGFVPPPPPTAAGHPFFQVPGAFPGPQPPVPGVEVPLTQPGALNVPVRPTHNANCDMCDSKIIGVRHKCTTCPDYDVCDSCFTIVAEQHPRHAFVKVRDPADLMIRPFHLSGKTPHHAKCDGCGKTILGARFKCLHANCPDFDLCENCEALPIDAHPSSHPLLKLKQPIGTYEGLDRTLAAAYGQNKSASPTAEALAEARRAAVERMAAYRAMHVTEGQIGEANGLQEASVISPWTTFRGCTPVHLSTPTPYTQAGYTVTCPVEDVKPVQSPVSILDEQDAENPFSMEPITPSKPEPASPSQAAPALIDIVQQSPFTDEHAEVTATSTTSQDRAVSPTTSQTSQTSESIRPSASFVDDNNVPDGQVMAAGTVFVKSWKLKNDGTTAWPAKTQLLFSGGDRMGTSPNAELLVGGGTEPGQSVDVSVELRAPSMAGRYSSYWRLKDEEGRPFGHRVWCDITVVEDARSESSLSASAVIMPAPVTVLPSPIEPVAATEAVSDFEGTVSTGSNVGDDEYLSDAWEEASRAESPDQFVMVYESSNASDSDD